MNPAFCAHASSSSSSLACGRRVACTSNGRRRRTDAKFGGDVTKWKDEAIPSVVPSFALPPLAACACLAAAMAAAVVQISRTRCIRRRVRSTYLRFLRSATAARTSRSRVSPPSAPPVSNTSMNGASETYSIALDAVRARADAAIDMARLSGSGSDQLSLAKGAAGTAGMEIPPERFAELGGARRRALQEAALAEAFAASRLGKRSQISTPGGAVRRKEKGENEKVGNVSGVVVDKDGEEKGWDRATMFWKMAERVNGRAAALGFAICLLREVAEPGHPGLWEQVCQVLVPIAQKTPPFLVAVVDRIADLLT